MDNVFSGVTPQRLDHFLVEYYTELSRSQVRRLIKEGQVLVNDEQQKTGYMLQSGDHVSITQINAPQDATILEPEPMNLDIIYEDDSLLVINKPAGLTIHPGIGQHKGTLVHGLVHHTDRLSSVNGSMRPGIVHRLDRETSGVIVTAKTNTVHRRIAAQFQDRTVFKKYLGITWGKWSEPAGTITAPIRRHRKDPTSYHTDENGRSAETEFKVQSEFRYFSIVEFRPRSGRTHQIRVHCMHMQHPIVMDEKYGGGLNYINGLLPKVQKDLKRVLKQLGRHALHAHDLSFVHPDTAKEVNFNVPLPHDMLALIDHFKRHYD